MDKEEKLLDPNKVNMAFEDVSKAFNKLGLTMVERWWVSYVYELSARKLMGDDFEKIKKKLEESESIKKFRESNKFKYSPK